MKSKVIHQDVYISIFIYVALAFLLTVSMKLPKDSSIFPKMLIIGRGLFNSSVLLYGIIKTNLMHLQLVILYYSDLQIFM